MACAAHELPPPAAIDASVRSVMARTHAQGLAIAVIDAGRPVYVQAYGLRNAKGDPLTVNTVMYGASLTKPVFAYTVMRLVDRHRIDLDASIAGYLPKPLPEYGGDELVDRYADWSALDARWRKLTPRILLTHSAGFANFGFLEPGGKLQFHFDPGARYAYSGDGLITLQFVLETGLGIDVGAETRRIFDEFGMRRTSLIWRPEFAANLADGWDAAGQVVPHDERSKVRAAGSMDTTIADFAKFAAAFVRGDGLSRKARAEMLRPMLPITTRTQFPSLQPELPSAERRKDLAAGLGLVVFEGPQGRGFFKGGHNDSTGNTWVCVEATRRCLVLLSNDVRAEAGFRELAELVLGPTGVPYDWEYGPASAPVAPVVAAGEAAVPIEQVATALAADYQPVQADRLLARGDRDPLIAAALIAFAPGAATARGIDDGEAMNRLVAMAPDDELALYVAALLCNTQKTPCAHPEYRERLLAKAPANAVHWLLAPSGAALTAHDLHAAAEAGSADTHFSAMLGIVRAALEGQGPRNPPEALRSNPELGLALRRNEIGRVPWPDYGQLMAACSVQVARSSDAHTRAHCASLGARLFDERGDNLVTRMIGGTLLRRFAKDTPAAAAAVQLRRRYVWISEQLPEDATPAAKERLNAEEITLGEWEAYQRNAERAGVPREPPVGWVPKRPELLLLQEDRPARPRP